MGGMSAAPREGGYSGYFGAPPPLTRSMSADAEALEAGRASLQQRLEAAERELREDKEASRGHRLRAEQLELKLKDREQLLVHAKEMWMKENVRASRLADALTAAEDKLADQEKRLSEVSERYAEAQQEVRQLRHLLGTSGGDGAFGGGGAGDLAAGFGADPYAPNSRAKVPASNGFAKNHHNPATTGNLSQATWHTSDLDASRGGGFGVGDELPAMGSPSRAMPSSSPQMSQPLGLDGDTNADRFRRLCLLNDAVLYEDELLQVGVKSEYSGCEGQLAVFFGNKSTAALQAFTVQYFVREEHALRLVASPISQQLEADRQIVQRLAVTLLEPFVETPWLRLQFLLPDASPRRIQLKFPIMLPKFMAGRELSPQDFFRHWRQQSLVLNEVTSIVHLAERLRGPLVHVARSIVFGGALRLHHGVDTNPDNFVLVSQLAEPSGGRGLDQEAQDNLCLIRVEVGSGRFTGKARVVVRSSDHVAAKALVDCIVNQLAEPNAPHASGVSGAR
ncbi:unnamed protein product [Polarella glacialis]|uniref:Clathrin adaptor alpha/beta/gamma-adaptin appendage Ig-like subdomain domain-containing protein n=2 Tax=Polarella glacialis TaxID=89957 RepID=A0A813HB34_POLGL|nr:unnamed protein product [Polarella glacialis]